VAGFPQGSLLPVWAIYCSDLSGLANSNRLAIESPGAIPSSETLTEEKIYGFRTTPFAV
jgi:hypothetical protein